MKIEFYFWGVAFIIIGLTFGIIFWKEERPVAAGILFGCLTFGITIIVLAETFLYA